MKTSGTSKSQSYLLSDPEALAKEIARLGRQARTLLIHEWSAIEAFGIKDSRSILELGCGNSEYLGALGERFPNASLYGVDRNTDLLANARSRFPNTKYLMSDLIYSSEWMSFLEEVSPDLVVVRFVLQHMSGDEVQTFLASLVKHRKNGRIFLFEEPDDSKISIEPNDDEFRHLVRETGVLQASRGGDRTIGGHLKALLVNAGFGEVEEQWVDLGTQTLGVGNFFESLLPIWFSAIPSNVRREVGENMRARLQSRILSADDARIVFPVCLVSAA